MKRIKVFKERELERLMAQVDIFIQEKTERDFSLYDPEYSDASYVPASQHQDSFWHLTLWWNDD
jgi:hypothetical protein